MLFCASVQCTAFLLLTYYNKSHGVDVFRAGGIGWVSNKSFGHRVAGGLVRGVQCIYRVCVNCEHIPCFAWVFRALLPRTSGEARSLVAGGERDIKPDG